MGTEVLPPDVNKSYRAFTVEGDRIRFGLGAIKNVGEGAIESIVREREENGSFTDPFDFCSRLDSKSAGRRILESLNKAGAFASMGWNRRQVEAVLDDAINTGQSSQRERASGQYSLLDLMSGGDTPQTFHQKPDLADWPEGELLANEREMLGLYVSSHPLAKYARIIDRFSTVALADIGELQEGQEVTIGGMLTQVKYYTTQKGKRMAFITIETLEGSCEVTIFSDLYEPNAGLFVSDMILMLKCRAGIRNDAVSLVAISAIPVDEAESQLTRAVHIRLHVAGLEPDIVDRLAELLGGEPGKCDVYLHCCTPDQEEITIHATSACKVAATDHLRQRVEELLGEESMWFSGGNGLPRHG